jgi:tetratricopeptide (TPR) repeat protein
MALKRAIELAPGNADSYGWLALVKTYLGEGEEAIRLIERAMTLNPRYSWDYLYILGRAHYVLGRYDEAAGYLEGAAERNQNSLLARLYLAATNVRLGRQEEAEWEILQIDMLHPGYSLATVADTHPVADEALRNQLLDDLRAAGMEE